MRIQLWCVLLSGIFVSMPAHAENLRVTIQPAQAGVDVCAFMKQTDGFTSPPLHAATANNGRAQFQNIDPGEYLLVASGADGAAGVSRSDVRGPGQTVVPMSLTDSGVVCSAEPAIRELQAQAVGADQLRAALVWRSSALAETAVEYCAKPTDTDGACPVCATTDDWKMPSNRGDGLRPLLTGSVDLAGYGKQTLCLRQRYAAQPDPLSNEIQATLVARFQLIELQVEDGRNRVTSPVSLSWSSTFRGNQDVEYRVSEDRDFDDAVWQSIEPVPDPPGEFRVPALAIAGQGFRRLRLQMRLAGQNGTRTNIVTDGFRLFIAAPPAEVYTLEAGPLFMSLQDTDWQFEVTPFGTGTGCFSPEQINSELGLAATGVSGCGFRIFTGRALKTGWTFEGFEFSTRSAPETTDPGECVFNALPLNNEGSPDPTIAIHVLALSQPDLPGAMPPPLVCQMLLETVTVRGPANSDGIEAFAEDD